MNCPNCGKPNLPQAQTCGNCGHFLRAPVAPTVLPGRLPEALERPRPLAKKTGCVGMLIGQIASFIVSSISGWVGGLLTAVFAPFIVQAIGSETARQTAGLLALALAVIPFTLSFLMALIGSLIFNRGRRAAV
jgi:hypothetical protein